MALRAVAEVNLAAIERNTKQLRSHLRSHTQLCAVVKADGYGHGAVQSARAAIQGGASYLAVATAHEADELRRAGLESTPILILGAVSEDELPLALATRAELAVWDVGFIERLQALTSRTGEPVRLHVKLDTGLGRLGTRASEDGLAVVHAILAARPSLELVGVMTHFATADDDLDFVAEQLKIFGPFVAEVRALATDDVIVHAANSPAILREPASHFDMVRAGIALYGCDPMNRDPAEHGLEPAMALRSYVAALKPIAAGQSTGYGRHFVAERDSFIATLPIGYGDGLPRALANNCDVLIGGRRYPLRGMVSMDNITVDVGPQPTVKVGDRGTLIGVDGGERQTAEDIARRLGTISYEVVCMVSRRVRRVYHRDGTPA